MGRNAVQGTRCISPVRRRREGRTPAQVAGVSDCRKKPLYVKQDAMKGCKPFIFHRIHRLCRWGGAIFRSKAQKNHFRSLAMQDEPFHPAWSVSKTSFFDTLERRPRWPAFFSWANSGGMDGIGGSCQGDKNEIFAPIRLL